MFFEICMHDIWTAKNAKGFEYLFEWLIGRLIVLG